MRPYTVEPRFGEAREVVHSAMSVGSDGHEDDPQGGKAPYNSHGMENRRREARAY